MSNHSYLQGWLAPDIEISGSTGERAWDLSRVGRRANKVPDWSWAFQGWSVLCWSHFLYEINWQTRKDGAREKKGCFVFSHFKIIFYNQNVCRRQFNPGEGAHWKLCWIADLKSQYMSDGLTKPPILCHPLELARQTRPLRQEEESNVNAVFLQMPYCSFSKYSLFAV